MNMKSHGHTYVSVKVEITTIPPPKYRIYHCIVKLLFFVRKYLRQ